MRCLQRVPQPNKNVKELLQAALAWCSRVLGFTKPTTDPDGDLTLRQPDFSFTAGNATFGNGTITTNGTLSLSGGTGLYTTTSTNPSYNLYTTTSTSPGTIPGNSTLSWGNNSWGNDPYLIRSDEPSAYPIVVKAPNAELRFGQDGSLILLIAEEERLKVTKDDVLLDGKSIGADAEAVANAFNLWADQITTVSLGW